MRLLVNKVKSFLLMVGLCVSSVAHASTNSIPIIRAVMIETPEAPVSAQLILSLSPELTLSSPGVIIRTSDEKKSIVVGRFQLDDGALKSSSANDEFVFLVAVIGASGRVLKAVEVAPISDLDSPTAVSRSNVSILKEVNLATSRDLATLEKQLSEQAPRLDQLQTEADIIANVGHIVDAEDKLGAVSEDVTRLKRSLSVMEERLEVLRSLPKPTSYSLREAELSSFLTTFSKTSNDRHAGALKKLADAESAMDDKVALIEATKSDHVDLLLKELVSLRKEREALQRSREVVVQPAIQ